MKRAAAFLMPILPTCASRRPIAWQPRLSLWIAALCWALSLTACVENAAGVKFDQAPQPQLEEGQARLFFFRDKVLYLVQAPTVVHADIIVDGRPVGGVKNGGFTEVIIPAGPHDYSVQSGQEQTTWRLDVPAGSTAYFQIWDKTRMEGARAAGGLLVGAAAGGAGRAIDEAGEADTTDTLRADVRSAAVVGVIAGGLQGAVVGFRGRVREGEGRIWAVDRVGEGEAMPLLSHLSTSD